MAEKQSLASDGTPTTYSDWPTLIERAVDDVSRILRSEARMFQTSIGATLEAQISNTLARLTIVAVIISGALCLLCSAIFLLHQWLPWWQVFGIAGLATLVIGIVSNAAVGHPSEVKT
jgi:VIT1/CCC1 family predicted Fe2+/Mn2+ transporter